ncbi:MFS transporter [Effusibacillus consociatus]|uniref:MFS transporter n=1 Tax=Effusibacillus consociatus TaxID=1117041 RepID=A0ABV9Q4U5_9BACL
MHSQLKRLLWLHGSFLGVVIFSNLFINLYLWSVFKNFSRLGQYNLTVALFTLIGFVLGMYVIRLRNIRYSLAGAILCMLTLFLLLVFREKEIVEWLFLLGSLYGSSLGMYYSGFNLISFFLTGKEERDLFFGREQMLNRFVSLVTPLTFSFIVFWFGYKGAFSLISSILMITVLLTFFIPKIKTDFTVVNLRYREVWQEYKNVLLSITGFGFLQSWIQIASSVFLFFYLTDSTRVGLWNSVFATIGIGMGYWMSKFSKPKNRKYLALTGTILLSGAALIIFFPKAWTVLAFNVLAALTLPMIWLPITVVHYNRISDLSCPSIDNCRIGLSAHYLVIREFMLNLGRVLFFLLMALGLGYEGPNIPVYIVFVILFLPIVIYRCNALFFVENKRNI